MVSMPVAGVLPETRTSCGMHKVIPIGIKTVSRLPEMSYIKCETGYISRGVPEKNERSNNVNEGRNIPIQLE